MDLLLVGPSEMPKELLGIECELGWRCGSGGEVCVRSLMDGVRCRANIFCIRATDVHIWENWSDCAV